MEFGPNTLSLDHRPEEVRWDCSDESANPFRCPVYSRTRYLLYSRKQTASVEIYLPSVGLELGENIAQNWEAYISLPAKFF